MARETQETITIQTYYNNSMLQIKKITVRNESGSEILFNHIPEETVILPSLFEVWRKGLIKYYSTLFDQPVKLDILRREGQKDSKTPMNILAAYCNVFDLDSRDILGKTRKSKIVMARMYINQICFDEGFMFAEIEDSLWGDRMFYHYKRKFNNLSETERGFIEEYEERKNKVINSMFE
jgi:hypothetical protein